MALVILKSIHLILLTGILSAIVLSGIYLARWYVNKRKGR